MSTRWMAVQYVGDTLRLPVVNDGDMDKPFGSSVLERDVKRIVVNPFSDSPQTFVPELENVKLREELEAVGTAAYLYGRDNLKAENTKLRELCRRFSEYVGHDRCEGCVVKRRCNDGEVDECWQMGEIRKLAHELGVEVEG